MNKIKISTIALLLFVAVMATGCVDYVPSSKPVKSDNPNYEVRKLFTVDGVTVYRFLTVTVLFILLMATVSFNPRIRS